MTVTLRAPTLAECQLVREWRNAPDVLPMLRTGYKTEEQQAAFYRDVVSNPESDHRYYAIEVDGQFCGFGGLTYLRRWPGEGEISLIIDPARRRSGLGRAATAALLKESVRLGLSAVVGESYRGTNDYFWNRMCNQFLGEGVEFGRSFFFRFEEWAWRTHV